MRATERHETIGAAFDHLVAASERVVMARLDLLRLEAREDLLTTARVTTLLVVAAILAFSSWLLIVALVVRALADYVPLMASLGIVAVLHVAVAAFAAIIALRDLGRMRVLAPDEPSTPGSIQH